MLYNICQMIFQGSWTMIPVAAIIRALINTLYSHRKKYLLPAVGWYAPTRKKWQPFCPARDSCVFNRTCSSSPRVLLMTFHIFNMRLMQVLTVLKGIGHLLCVDPVVGSWNVWISAAVTVLNLADLNAVWLVCDVPTYGLIKILVRQKQKPWGAMIKVTESNGLCVLQPLGHSNASTSMSHVNNIIFLFSFMCE